MALRNINMHVNERKFLTTKMYSLTMHRLIVIVVSCFLLSFGSLHLCLRMFLDHCLPSIIYVYTCLFIIVIIIMLLN